MRKSPRARNEETPVARASVLWWTVTIVLIVGLLAFDLIFAAARPHAVGFKEAVGWSVFYILIAVAFGLAFMWYAGADFGAQYFAGYIVEKSLSVDNRLIRNEGVVVA